MSCAADEQDGACDSRTASVDLSQGRSRGTSSSESRTTMRIRKNPMPGRGEAGDLVAREAVFTNMSPGVDESSSSSSSQVSNSSEAEPTGQIDPSRSRSSPRGIAPAVNWNKGSKGAIRTTLRGKGLRSTTSTPISTSFEVIEGKYWRSRSGSASTTGSRDQHGLFRGDGWNKEHDPQETSLDIITKGQLHGTANSDDFVSGDVSECDDAIVLNLGPSTRPRVLESSPKKGITTSHDNLLQCVADSSNALQSLQVIPDGSKLDSQGADGGSEKHMSTEDVSSRPLPEGLKGAAFRSFALKYNPSPVTLADLMPEDLELQVKYFFYDLPLQALDLSLPPRCIDCMKEGHLAEVCPGKECEHCGVWAIHESQFCPSWRRCQKCRERGHDKGNCPSRLQVSVLEAPCDLCGSTDHMENGCDMMWKIPKRDTGSGQIFISVSCCHCTSRHHLVGDCPTRPFPMSSSSWTLKHHDPLMVSHWRPLPYSRTGGGLPEVSHSVHKIKGRAAARSPSPKGDGVLGRFDNVTRIRKGPPRPPTRFDSTTGQDGKFEQDSIQQHSDQFIPHDYRRGYRDRNQFFVNDRRQRSLSPDLYPSRQRNSGDSWYPPQRPRIQSQQAGRGNGRGDGSSRGRRTIPRPTSERDTYRPMPSAAKRAWDQHRL